jgi:hypothetical protein
MAVKISGLKPTITLPARLHLPDDGGKFFVHEFDVVFKRLPTERRDELHAMYSIGKRVETVAEGASEPTVEVKRISTPELLDEIVEGWERMLDEHGNPVPYSHEERRATDLVYAGLEQAMAVSWYDHIFIHQREAAQKNSGAQSGTTSAVTTRAAT